MEDTKIKLNWEDPTEQQRIIAMRKARASYFFSKLLLFFFILYFAFLWFNIANDTDIYYDLISGDMDIFFLVGVIWFFVILFLYLRYRYLKFKYRS